ncbi:toxic anion resistance protein [Paenibacillus senegalimassiliensis]|uniref:toxic anion resistance protein n=1 Tax=Paenibacillus senegalimassiliensis TaxID=1737426 RepID=UPI00073E8F6A|nr:toxic anion resistance protein [Paenibacillus senegalimassiliensis]
MTKENENILQVPELTLELEGSTSNLTDEIISTKLSDVDALLNSDGNGLTEPEKVKVREFVQKIDITNATHVLQYGYGAQQKVADFSENALSNVRTKDMGEVGSMISGLVVELKGFSTAEENKGFFGLFRRAGRRIEELRARFAAVERNVDSITDVLEQHNITLLKDVALLDRMYDLNLSYFKELTMYILAGRMKLKELTTTELPRLQEMARQSGKPEDAQAANSFADICNRFDKKLHDLSLTRTISLQMGPQIKLIQNTNSIMVEKIQSSLVNTIPLWKNQMVLALGMAHSQKAIEAQRAVTDITNDLLRKNADMLKSNTVDAAREAERSIVDVETLKHTNQQLIKTLDEVLAIQNEGFTKRRQAEGELVKIENELKNKLLEVRNAVQR